MGATSLPWEIQPNGDIRVGKRITGAAPYSMFNDQLDIALAPWQPLDSDRSHIHDLK